MPSRRVDRLVALSLLCMLGAMALFGQAVPSEGRASSELDPQTALELDIRTSTLLELAAWCRELGLSESGGREELAKRLRAHFKLAEPKQGGAAGAKKAERVVVVESAQGSEYFTLEAAGEEYARLRGGVVVSFKDGEATHRIKAREILYNRTRNTLSASGSVEYEKTSGDSKEFFRGESLSVDIETWTGVFLDGMSEKSKTGDDTAYRFAAEVISRAPEGVTVLADATVTTAGEGEAYWSLRASRIWLLPGSEWAISNAILKVGEIPVLYFPFFYFPGDDLVFHPVLGYRNREGSYVQTTTYLIGRPKASASTEKSIMTMLEGDSDEERRQEGIFLRRTGKRAPPDTGERLSLLFDAYANLGYYLGLEAALPKGKLFSKAELSLGLGFSRDIYSLGDNYYSPFTEEHPNGNWHSARIPFATVPFRYRLLSTGSMTFPFGNLAWNVPFYSDPYVDQDFRDRSEDMDWLNLIKQGSATEDKSDIDVLGGYELSLSGSLSPKLPALAPWVNTLSVSSLKSALSMRTKTDASEPSYSPYRTFFYPEKLSLVSLSGTISGKPLSLGSSSTPAAKPAAASAGAEKPASAVGTPRAPWEAKESAPPSSAAKEEGAVAPPVLTQKFAVPSGASSSSLELGYTLSPSFSSDIVYNTSSWNTASDIAWDDVASVLLSSRGTGKLTASAALPKNTLSMAMALNANAAWQSNAYLNEKAAAYDTEAERQAAAERNFSSTYLKTTGELSVSAKPFASDPVWSATSLNYSLKGKLVDSSFDGTWDAPSWSWVPGEWTKDSISAHEASLNLAALVRDLAQSLKLSSSIHPRPSELSAAGVVRVWNSTTSASASVTELEEGGTFDPITITETLSFGASRSFSQTVVFDPEKSEFTNAATALNLGGFSASFSAKNAVGYELDPDIGWFVSDTEQRLRPQSLSFSYKSVQTVPPLWKNRINLNYNLNAGFSFDFQRYTQSSFNFALSTTLKVSKFLDISFSSTSINSVVFRYFQDLPWFELPFELPGEKNPLVDLFDSFNFFDPSKRLSSGFKLKSMAMSAKHYLGDWTAELSLALTPYLDKTVSPYAYKFNNEVSFLVKWTPVPEFKVKTFSDKDGFSIE